MIQPAVRKSAESMGSDSIDAKIFEIESMGSDSIDAKIFEIAISIESDPFDALIESDPFDALMCVTPLIFDPDPSARENPKE